MVWHIFRKDLRLLWPLAAMVAAVQFINAAFFFILGHFGEPRELALIAQLFPNAVLLGMAALTVTAVHQDAIPGDRQDWLVRPIRRRDLILAKLLFVVVAVHGPMLLADMAHAMATGFAFRDSLAAAFSRGVLMLLSFSLPVLALAAMTSTFVEVVGGALAIGLVLAVFLFVANAERALPLLAGSMNWVINALFSAVALAAAVAVIPLQYLRRATGPARGLALGAALFAPISAFTPWAQAFSFQQWLSPDPAAGEAVAVAFDPDLGKSAPEPGGNPANSVGVPLRVSGLAPESLVISDRTDVRIIGRDGTILFRGRATGDPQTTSTRENSANPVADFPVRTTAGGDVRTHELITLPGKTYDLARSQQVRVELDYALTLFHIEASDKIAALNGDKRIVDFGWCRTRLDDDGDEVDLGCLKTGRAPTCITATLENTVSGERNPAYNVCRPDYTPYAAHAYPDVMTRFGGGLKFRDLQGLAKYPVDSTQLADAQVLLKSYRPVAHFTRRLVIPEIRLGDWEAETLETKTSASPLP
ncbi:MAG: ABC transporter permease [Rhodospirillaceae bacterium]